MKISDEFPSKYVKSSDLKGQEVRVIMQNVEKEKFDNGDKLVLYFKGKEKGVVLNKTNCTTISDAYGDDTDDWYDQPLIIFSIRTEYQGKPVDGIRCRAPTAKDNKQTAKRKEDPISSGPQDTPRRRDEPPPVRNDDLDDSIPF